MKKLCWGLILTALVLSLAACQTQPAESVAESGGDTNSSAMTTSAESDAASAETTADSKTGETRTTKSRSGGAATTRYSVETTAKTTSGQVTDVTQFIRKEKGLSIADYKKQLASFKLSDPLNKKVYSEAEKEAQRQAASKLRSRLNVAIAAETANFKVGAGVYRFAGQIPFELSGVQNMYIDLSGCTFILEGTQQFILGRGCKNVIFQGPATIDREGSLATQFTVTEYNESQRTLTVKLMEGYSLCSKALGGGTLQWFEPDGSMIQMAFIPFTGAGYVDEANGIVKFEGVACNRDMSNEKVLKAGQIGSVGITGGMALNVGLYSCTDIQLLDITNYGAGMMMHTADSNGALTLKRVYNVRMPGTNRLVAGSAGQMEFTAGTPTIEDCIFGFCEDDSIDIMGHVGFLYKQENSRTVIIKGTSTALYARKGETLSFFDGKDYTRKVTAKAVKVEEITDSSFNTAVRTDMVKNYNFYEVLTTQNCVRVTLDRDVALKTGDMVENMDACRPINAVLRGNYFHDMGCRVLIQGCKGLLFENNTIERSGLAALCIDCEQRDWGEGPNSYDLVIRNNTIRESNSSPYSCHFVFQHIGAISVGPFQYWVNGMTPSKETDAYRNITIEGNKIYDANYAGILVKNSAKVMIRNNLIQNPVTKLAGPHSASGKPLADTAGVYFYGEEADYAVYLWACEQISMSGNTFTDMGQYCLGETKKVHCR